MRISPEGIQVLHHFEQCRLEAYPDPGSRDGKPWTIGWGHTGPEVVKGLKWTQARADETLLYDLRTRELAIIGLVRRPLNQAQFDALVCFVYNVGVQAFRESTMLAMINAGDYDLASKQFARWNKNDGNAMRGLVRRREAERCLFIGLSAEEAVRRGQAAA
jgi:lysozyme